jgi:excisionase family DNA binding protein
VSDGLHSLFAPGLIAVIEQLVDERVAAALASMPTPDDGAPWLTLEQAAERLDCSTDAVRMRVKRGRLESRRQGRRLYVSRVSVDGIA